MSEIYTELWFVIVYIILINYHVKSSYQLKVYRYNY